MRLERLAQPQLLWMKRERPLIPTSLVRSLLRSLNILWLTHNIKFLQNTLLKLHGTWIPEDPRYPTNVDPSTTTPPTNSTSGTTGGLLPVQPRRSTEKAHAKTVVR